ncbi:hypothetical protein [Vibrio sp. E14]|uniref:hypothetical protein n=1 Tax=Vibrio sp. E14 TaxID=2849869 RepID=UPI001CF8830C|nr:hypothetical protein [Vibrio sp. E14]
MSNYYTNFIDPGNSGGSVPTPDTTIPFTPNTALYACRFCSATFATDHLRVSHEWDEHPSKNPQLHIFQKAVGSTRLVIHTKLSPEDIELTYCDQIFINGEAIDIDVAPELLSSKHKYFFEVRAVNQGVTREFKIDIDVADSNELEQVDKLFWVILSRDDFTEELVTQFVKSCADFNTTVEYVDGIVKYLQGIMAKDGKAQVLTFEDFDKRFNQARSKLQQFNTPLSRAIQSVIDFNQNQFGTTGLESVPFLKQAMALFLNDRSLYVDKGLQETTKKLPVDRMTALLVDDVINNFDEHSVDSIQEFLDRLPRRNISLNDRQKLQFLLVKKAYNTGHKTIIKPLIKRLASADTFNLNFIEETDYE